MTKQEKISSSRIRVSDPDDEIVISGISGKFPNAENVEEFARNLYNKVNKSHLQVFNWYGDIFVKI